MGVSRIADKLVVRRPTALKTWVNAAQYTSVELLDRFL
jgi:hypothetical protein